MVAVDIFLVEDDEVDVMALKRALRELKIANPLFRAADGIEALEMLRGENGEQKSPRPRIILLDLNMPWMSGLEFLAELRGDADLQRSIVFMMTTSAAGEDRFRLHGIARVADAYFRLGGDEFTAILDPGSDGTAVARRIVRAATAKPIISDRHSLSVEISIGLVRFPADGGNAQDLVRTSNAPMYDAKKLQAAHMQIDADQERRSA